MPRPPADEQLRIVGLGGGSYMLFGSEQGGGINYLTPGLAGQVWAP